MGRGYAVNPDDSYAGWYGHEQSFSAKGFPPNISFVADDGVDARLPALEAERDAPPPPMPPTLLNDLDTLARTSGITAGERGKAQGRVNARTKPPQS